MRGAATGDAYVRLSPIATRTRLYGSPARPDAILFVDVDANGEHALQCVLQLRDLPYSQFIGVSRVIVRFPLDFENAFRDELAAVVREVHRLITIIAPSVLRADVLEQRFGEEAVLHRCSTASEDLLDDATLRRLRGVELSALLESNHAVWSPNDYHFVLPSGAHVRSFVRVADGFSGPRDVHVLGTWLLPDAGPDRGYLFDNRSLTPLAVTLDAMYHRAGVAVGPMTFLEHYPDTQFDVEAATQEAASSGGGVVGVLSVSSAGDTRARLLSAFDRAGQPSWKLHVLLDRARLPDSPAGAAEARQVTTWLGFRAGDDEAMPSNRCGSCLTSERRRVVAIDPRFFDGMVLPRPTLSMLAPGRAQAAAPFWEACERAGAAAIEHKPTAATRARRARVDDKSGRMGVFVSLERLLSQGELAGAAVQATKALLARSEIPPERFAPQEALADIDLIVVSSREATGETGAKFLALLVDVVALLPASLTEDSIRVVNADEDPSHWDKDVIGALAGSKKVLIAGFGVVSGHSMQRLLVGCQEHLRRADEPQPLVGLVIHARLETSREWATLRNSFGLQLFALFDTPLPSTSPLRRESSTLTQMRRDIRESGGVWEGQLSSFLDSRAAICAGDGTEIDVDTPSSYVPLLWGMPRSEEERSHIRQHSLFGHKLGPAAFLGAVGSAVHRERQRIAEEPGPVWQLFEMPALLRSYYDPLLIASMLRWMDPSEIWWGDDALEVVVRTIERAPVEDRAVLLPELLLAASHGKVPSEAANHVEQVAESTLRSPPDELGDDVVVAIGAGLIAWRGERASRERRAVAKIEPLPEWQR